MIRNRAYKTKLRPTLNQRIYFAGCAGAARFVYNWFLQRRMEHYEEAGETLNKFEAKRIFNATKDEFAPWIREYPYVVTEAAFDHLDTAYKNFFRRVREGSQAPGFPKFKSRHKHNSFTLRGSIRVERDRIKLPKIGWVNLAEKGYLPTDAQKLMFVTVSKRADEWFVSLTVEVEVDAPEAQDGPALGVDIGVRNLVTASNGFAYENPRSLMSLQAKRTRLQRELSRRTQGGQNWKKTKSKLQKIEKRIADARAHHQHNATRTIADMGARRVTVEGTNYRELLQDSDYAYWGSDAAMGETRRQIQYKGEWAGSEVIVTNGTFAPNKICSICHHENEHTCGPERRYFECESCGEKMKRNLNSAKNLQRYSSL